MILKIHLVTISGISFHLIGLVLIAFVSTIISCLGICVCVWYLLLFEFCQISPSHSLLIVKQYWVYIFWSSCSFSHTLAWKSAINKDEHAKIRVHAILNMYLLARPNHIFLTLLCILLSLFFNVLPSRNFAYPLQSNVNECCTESNIE